MRNRKADHYYKTPALKVLQAHNPGNLLKFKQKFDKTNAQNLNLSYHLEDTEDYSPFFAYLFKSASTLST